MAGAGQTVMQKILKGRASFKFEGEYAWKPLEMVHCGVHGPMARNT